LEQEITLTTEMLAASDGLGLHRSSFVPPRPRAQLILVHGYADHQGRYAQLRRELALAGLSSHMVDLRGHGRSGGARGHIARFADYLTDLRVLQAQVRKEAPELPLFLVGHSMGGLIVLLEALEHPAGLAGVVASGPMLGLAMPVPGWKKLLGRVVSAIWPGLAMSNGIQPEMLSHDPAVREAFGSDPLRHRVATARWFTEAEAAMAAIEQRAEQLEVPSLFLLGSEDPIIDQGVVRRFSARVPPTAHELVCFEGLLHEVWLELPPGGEQARQRLISWVGQRLELAPAVRTEP